MIDSKVTDSFNLMWGSFPEPALLIHKCREIIAVNKIAQKAGRVVGSTCAAYGPPHSHKNCLANQALTTQQPAIEKVKLGDKEIAKYWLPLEGYPDLYVHIILGVTINSDLVTESAARE